MERLTHITIIRDHRSLGEYRPGEVGKPFTSQDEWYSACPECGGRAGFGNHQVTENADGTLTFSPSLLCPGVDSGRCSAHNFIESNQIRWV
jgi:hypothetical protein